MLALWCLCTACFLPVYAAAAQGVENAELTIPLRIAGLNVPSDLTAKYPHLYGCTHLELDEQYSKQVRHCQRTQAGNCFTTVHCTGAVASGRGLGTQGFGVIQRRLCHIG